MYKYFFILSLVFLASCTVPGTTPPSGTGTLSSVSVAPKVMIASPTYGSGKHTVTIFADFQCPACIAFSKAVGPILEGYASKGQLLITYKQYPLTGIHKNALRDALAGLCGAEQGKHTDYKKALYAMEEKKSGALVSDADRIAAGSGILDATKLAECLSTDRYLPQVYAEIREGDALGVTGTPTVYFDGKKLDNKIFSDLPAFQTIMARWLEIGETGSGMAK